MRQIISLLEVVAMPVDNSGYGGQVDAFAKQVADALEAAGLGVTSGGGTYPDGTDPLVENGGAMTFYVRSKDGTSFTVTVGEEQL